MPKININKEFGFNYKDLGEYPWDDACDDLPYRVGHTKDFLGKSRDWWLDREFRYKGQNLYRLTTILVNNFVGKSIDDAYSKFCKLVPNKNHRWLFWNAVNRGWWGKRYIRKYIDDNKIIRISPPSESSLRVMEDAKKPYIFNSADFESGTFDRISGKKVDFSFNFLTTVGWGLRNLRMRAHAENLVTSGYQVEVYPKSKLEHRLKWEYRSKKRQLERARKQRLKEIEYSFLTREEEKRKFEEEQEWRLQWK